MRTLSRAAHAVPASEICAATLVTGAGSIGLLAALMARQRGYELHVYDRDRGAAKRDLVARIAGQYHCDSIEAACALAADVTIDCTGASEVIAKVIGRNAPAASCAWPACPPARTTSPKISPA